MFKLEFFSLLKEIKNTQGNQRKDLLKSLNKLLEQHQQEYQQFVEQGMITQDIQEIIKEAQQISQTPSKEEENDDMQRIKNSYYKWLEDYKNNSTPTQTMFQIVKELVQFYAPNRFSILQKVLEINDTQDFEAFKLHLKNTIRAYFAEQIEQYIQSEEYQQLWFLPRMRKYRQIRQLLIEINNYTFNKQKIDEVLK